MGMSPIAQAAPRVAVFDVNETLSDLSGLVPRLTEVGAPPDLLPAWFAATLRDGFARTATGHRRRRTGRPAHWMARA